MSGKIPSSWPTYEEFVRAHLASTSYTELAALVGLTEKQVRSKASRLRIAGVKLERLKSSQGNHRANQLDVAKLNRLIDRESNKILRNKKRIEIE